MPHRPNPPESSDDRSAIAQAYAWSVRISTVSMEMVIPALIGLWLDQKLGTVLLFVVLGAALGMTLGMIHLIRMTGPKPETKDSSDRNPHEGER